MGNFSRALLGAALVPELPAPGRLTKSLISLTALLTRNRTSATAGDMPQALGAKTGDLPHRPHARGTPAGRRRGGGRGHRGRRGGRQFAHEGDVDAAHGSGTAIAQLGRRDLGHHPQVRHQNAQAQLRAPIFEDKVVDLILGQAQVSDEKVSKEDLMKEDDMPAGYGA